MMSSMKPLEESPVWSAPVLKQGAVSTDTALFASVGVDAGLFS